MARLSDVGAPVALALLFVVYPTSAQEPVPFDPITNRDFNVSHTGELFDYTPPIGQPIIVDINGTMDTVLVQETTPVTLNCEPWLRRFPNASIAWYFRPVITYLL